MKYSFRSLSRSTLLRFLVLTLSLTFAAPPNAMAIRKRPARAAAAKAPSKGAGGATAEPSGPECKALYLVEPASGTVISEVDADEALAPASMTKLMLSYVVLKRLHEGTIKDTDMITVSAHASKIGGSQVYLKENEQFSLKDLLDAVLIQSANDAATAIAEHIGGTPEGFVEMMNQEAQAIGMTNAHFTSPHGLPPSPGQKPDLVSARSMGVLAQALLREFPQVVELTKQTDADFRNGEFHMANHNHLLKSFPGCDGLKTGFYNEAGFNITATAMRNGVRMVAVAMDCASRKGRDMEVSKLLSTGLSQYRPVTIVSKGKPVDQVIAVSGGDKDSVPALADADLTAVVKTGDEKKVVKKLELCTGLTAPVAANTPCGTLAAYLGDKEIGRVGLMVGEPVQEMGRIAKMRARLGF